jgi:predicted nucleic acid-binding protein
MAQDIIIDTSTLINFLRIGRVDLLSGLMSYRFIVTDHVRAEVTTHYPAQLANLESTLQAGHLSEVSLTDPAELAVFAAMQSLRVLGDGECSAIAAASAGKVPLAIDDIPARKKAAAHDPRIRLLDTVGLMVEAIQAGLLTVAEADAIKADWAKNHRFAKKHFSSFAELIP